MSSKYTPGPWNISENRVHDFKDGGLWVVAVFANDAPSGDKVPAECRASTREQALANARLVEAAPDMHQALEDLLPLVLAYLQERAATMIAEEDDDADGLPANWELARRYRAAKALAERLSAQAAEAVK